MLRALFCLCIFSWAQACAADDLAERVFARLASYPVVRAEFIQERTVTGLTRPVTSTGRMVLSREQGLLWQVDTPVRATVVFTASGPSERGAAQAEMARLVRAILSGDLRELRSSFALEAQGELDRWTVRLVPKARELAQYLRVIELAGGKHLEAIGIDEASGERLVVRMRNFVIGGELEPAERKALLLP
jgi:outer membrane lipoprotein carrier protein LolA